MEEVYKIAEWNQSFTVEKLDAIIPEDKNHQSFLAKTRLYMLAGYQFVDAANRAIALLRVEEGAN
jgi:hypothetical protein